MKPTVIVFSFVVTILYSTYAQKTAKGFSDIKISYLFSTVNPTSRFTGFIDVVTPYGIGIETTASIKKKLNFSVGLAYKSSQNLSFNGGVSAEFGGYSGPTFSRHLIQYIAIPLHLQYTFFNSKSFGISSFFGAQPTLTNWKVNNIIDIEGKSSKYVFNYFGVIFDCGLEENYRLSDKIGLFATQGIGWMYMKRFIQFWVVEYRMGLKYNFN